MAATRPNAGHVCNVRSGSRFGEGGNEQREAICGWASGAPSPCYAKFIVGQRASWVAWPRDGTLSEFIPNVERGARCGGS